MKIKTIRHGVFESNSSSSHSITIENETVFTSIVPDTMGEIRLIGGEFGWETDDHYHPLTKANYCAQDLFYMYSGYDSDSVSSKMLDTNQRFNLLKEVIEEHTGAKVVFNIKSLQNGYIDHQSIGTSDKAFKSKETLKNFIFGKMSYLHTGNDNGDY